MAILARAHTHTYPPPHLRGEGDDLGAVLTPFVGCPARCVCVCVCVRERERERERECVCVCACVRSCVCMCDCVGKGGGVVCAPGDGRRIRVRRRIHVLEGGGVVCARRLGDCS